MKHAIPETPADYDHTRIIERPDGCYWIDAETGEVILVDTGSRAFRKEFAARAQEDNSNLKRGFQLANLDFINIRTDQSYIVPLINFFKMRERRAR